MRLVVGPLPPAVYWRRRALVLGAVLLALFLVAQACISADASPGDEASGEASPSGAPTPSPSSDPATPHSPAAGQDGDRDAAAPEESPDAAGGQPPDDGRGCSDEEMLITASSRQVEFPSGAPMEFTIKIKNISQRPCHRDVGADLQELYLIQGTGTVKVWSSDHCGAAEGSDVRDFPANHERSYSVTWNGGSSGECDGEPPAPAGEVPGPGEYQLIGRLGSAYSEPLTITLT